MGGRINNHPSRPGPTRISPAAVRALPKADLHSHIDGSISPKELFRIARKYHRKVVTPEGAELESVSAFMGHIKGDGYVSMLDDIIRRFYPITRLLQTEETIREAGVSYLKGQNDDGVVYAEGRFAPQYHTAEGLSLGGVISSMAEGLAEGTERYGVETSLIVAIGRESPPGLGEEVARAAVRSGVAVALDLGGPEAGNPPEKFERAFRLATSSGLKVTIHAGEDAGSRRQDVANMKTALAMGADRLGHAIHLSHERNLLSTVLDRSVGIEMNPVSNLVLGKIKTTKDLGIDRLLKEGVSVSLNSDDPSLWTGGDLSEVYSRVCSEYGFGMDQVDALAENAFRSSFASQRVKERLVQRYREARRRIC